jgi:poly(A) polymerase
MALRENGLHKLLFPLLDKLLSKPETSKFLRIALENTDQRLHEDKPVSAGFLFAALLWHEVEADWIKRQAAGEYPVPALVEAMNTVEDKVQKRMAIPNRYGAAMKEIWLLQPRFEQRVGTRPWRLMEQQRFRAAYDFLMLRVECGMVEKSLGDWWTRFQNASEDERVTLMTAAADNGKPAASSTAARKRRRRKPTAPKAE